MRTSKNIVEYFPHMARQGKTLFILKNHYGNDGYAFWFQLLELLCISENHYYDCREEHSWQYLLAQTGVKETTGIEILGLLAKLGNIDLKMWEHRIIWCPNLVNNLEDVYKKRGRPAPDKPSCELITVPEKPITAPEKSLSGTEIPQSKVKHSEVNNSIEGIAASKISDNGSESLYKLLEGTKEFPAYSPENFSKLEDVMRDYDGLNYLLEFKKYKEYWNTRKLKRPWLALRNWLDRAKEGKVGKDKGRRLPNPKEYEPTADYPDL